MTWNEFDSRPLPRGDWSGDPETFSRPRWHLGGDLRPGHPWLSMPKGKRAEMWARGYRPDPYEQMDPWIRFEQWRTGTEPPCLLPGGRGCMPRTEPFYASHYWPQAFPLPVSREEQEEERAQIALAERMRLGEMPIGTAPIEDPKFRAEMRIAKRRLGGSADGGHMVGAFFYDPDLAKFGNAVSPLVEASSYEAAHLALQRPFEDRYNPRYEGQTWTDFMAMGEGSYDPSRGQDPNLPGGVCGCFPTRECLERHGLLLSRDPLDDWRVREGFGYHDDAYGGGEFVGVDPGPTCWTDPDTGVISMFPTLEAAKRAAEGRTDGFFDSVSEKTGLKKGTILTVLGIGGATALLMSRHPRHAFGIGAAGAAGAALSVAIDLGGRGAAFWSG